MSDEERKQEEAVFDQKIQVEELEAASGGIHVFPYGDTDDDVNNCVEFWHRPMYGPSGKQFPYCAATVEKGSCCNRNDGCYKDSVVYDGMRTECGRTWE